MTYRSASRLTLAIFGATGVVSGSRNSTLGLVNSKSPEVFNETERMPRSGARKEISFPSRRQNAMPCAPCSESFHTSDVVGPDGEFGVKGFTYNSVFPVSLET